MTSVTSAEELARRLVAREVAQEEPGAGVFAAQAACEQTYRAFARSVGAAGAHMLLSRALGKTSLTHPLLKNIRIEGMSELGMRGVSDIVRNHGEHATTAALQALLETFLGLLSQLIGEDLVAKLTEQIAPDSPRRQESAP